MNSVGTDAARTLLGQNLTFGLMDLLGHAIVGGAFADGTLPTEPELELQYTVSRTVVREAVKMLAAKGMVITRPRQGSVIEPQAAWNLFDPQVLRWLVEGPPSAALLRQLCEFAMEIEPSAAALAARLGSEADHARIAAACDRLIEGDSPASGRRTTVAPFHRALLTASGNLFHLRMAELVEGASRVLARCSRAGASPPILAERYRSVTHAIRARAPQRARTEMSMLLELTFEPITGSLRALDQSSAGVCWR